MPYPNYTLKEKCENFFSDLFMYLPLIIRIVFGAGGAILAATLGYYGVIWSSIASPVALFCWLYMNYTFWSYEGWRSSGPRGRIVNPFGPSSSDVGTTVYWLLFGVFFHCYHVWLRSNLRYRIMQSKKS